MDTIRIESAQGNTLAEELLAPRNAREQPTVEFRRLADWELALAAGGDVTPDWP
jgi:hypothetical protein